MVILIISKRFMYLENSTIHDIVLAQNLEAGNWHMPANSADPAGEHFCMTL